MNGIVQRLLLIVIDVKNAPDLIFFGYFPTADVSQFALAGSHNPNWIGVAAGDRNYFQNFPAGLSTAREIGEVGRLGAGSFANDENGLLQRNRIGFPTPRGARNGQSIEPPTKGTPPNLPRT